MRESCPAVHFWNLLRLRERIPWNFWISWIWWICWTCCRFSTLCGMCAACVQRAFLCIARILGSVLEPQLGHGPSEPRPKLVEVKFAAVDLPLWIFSISVKFLNCRSARTGLSVALRCCWYIAACEIWKRWLWVICYDGSLRVGHRHSRLAILHVICFVVTIAGTSNDSVLVHLFFFTNFLPGTFIVKPCKVCVLWDTSRMAQDDMNHALGLGIPSKTFPKSLMTDFHDIIGKRPTNSTIASRAGGVYTSKVILVNPTVESMFFLVDFLWDQGDELKQLHPKAGIHRLLNLVGLSASGGWVRKDWKTIELDQKNVQLAFFCQMAFL